ncbi:MAG: DUF5606 domain-containing protein [Chitinophagales bacterium]|nr:DUF5606 domain-containing protein [Chitinophagales bacterium]
MEFKDILSISGMPGLFELVSTKNNGIIVKSLEDGTSQFISSRIQGVSPLDNISVYLKQEETIELKKILRDMMNKENELTMPNAKDDPAALKDYFKKVEPEYDEEKVHVSDMKKMIKWYHLLKQHNLIPAEEEKTEEKETEKTGVEAEEGEKTEA